MIHSDVCALKFKLFFMTDKPTNKVEKKLLKNARNVLALPRDVHWTAIEPDRDLQLLFIETLKLARTISPQLPWFEMRKLSKEERKSKIEEFFLKLPPEDLASHKKARALRKSLTVGVNDTSRGLERDGLLGCCLVSGQARPRLLVSHLVSAAEARHVPLLVFENLKQLTTDSLGFSSLAIGFKKKILQDPQNEMYKLCNVLLDLYRNKSNGNSSESQGLTEEETEQLLHTEDKQQTRKKIEIPVLQKLEDVYLLRESCNYRVFRPNEEQREDSGLIQGMSPDEVVPSKKAKLSIVEENDLTKHSLERPRVFRPPTILRVKIDPNKTKRKNKKKKKP